MSNLKDPSKFSNKVVKAFQDTGTKPECGTWSKLQGNKLYCCGLTVLALKEELIGRKTPYDDVQNIVSDWASNEFGDDFKDSFIEGFDGQEKAEYDYYNDEAWNGYKCGRLAAQKLGLI